MIAKLQSNLPNHKVISDDSSNLYIVDFKQINKGQVTLLNQEPDVAHVHLENENNVRVLFDGFEDNALEIYVGVCSKQCECILFPAECGDKDWILCIETKYVHNIENAFRESNDYPNSMVTQILDTVSYFRSTGIIEENRRVDAIVSFPTLIEDFSASFFSGDLTIEDILINHNVKIRATNYGRIISPKRLVI